MADARTAPDAKCAWCGHRRDLHVSRVGCTWNNLYMVSGESGTCWCLKFVPVKKGS